MKTTVVYYSKTGNTQMIADAIATAVGGDARAINLMKRGKKRNRNVKKNSRWSKTPSNPVTSLMSSSSGHQQNFESRMPKLLM